MTGKLYLVGTPIGNLRDITLRALETLKECDIVAAEDTRQSLKLLNHFNIKKTMISYHKFNENDKSNQIIDLLLSGKNIALVTDAGMPGISDPGSVIVNRCIENNIDFEVIPGATALITALVYSGIDTGKFTFRGFLPRENKNRCEVLEEIKEYRDTIIIYEAPHRLRNTLDALLDVLGDRCISICRELTKLHENIFRDTIKGAVEYYRNNDPRGEYVLIISGKSDEDIEKEKRAKWENLTIKEQIMRCIAEGSTKKEAIKITAKERGISKSEVYKHSLDI
ncbi:MULTISPECIES: 16S rRNA (cytidine(1402)-2'-O)-methyltransferase [Clostridium]|jgi:16S rRNA (cytidine1402-2'-O)-methyltransferase|uniref:16S rRNA (cytidine(1402)-2'-O)-methyltransferase n=1 Tax=Clostridium TaxID=1485 RepID=UPI0002884663|nr:MULTISPECIES: 16S rRNA (cytidine(1402)-2'-O)-methyltransferase [Clostridium]MDF2504247.1 putative S-adenosylmethionine-dependent methyltransferase, YraL family [Clostridium sp.]